MTHTCFWETAKKKEEREHLRSNLLEGLHGCFSGRTRYSDSAPFTVVLHGVRRGLLPPHVVWLDMQRKTEFDVPKEAKVETKILPRGAAFPGRGRCVFVGGAASAAFVARVGLFSASASPRGSCSAVVSPGGERLRLTSCVAGSP